MMKYKLNALKLVTIDIDIYIDADKDHDQDRLSKTFLNLGFK